MDKRNIVKYHEMLLPVLKALKMGVKKQMVPSYEVDTDWFMKI